MCCNKSECMSVLKLQIVCSTKMILLKATSSVPQYMTQLTLLRMSMHNFEVKYLESYIRKNYENLIF